jgi:hypothetical protein
LPLASPLLLLLPGLSPESLPAAKAGALNANARADAAANIVILVIGSVVMAGFLLLVDRRPAHCSGRNARKVYPNPFNRN